MYERVLVPTDGSDHSGLAAEHAINLAEQFDAIVHALSSSNGQGRAVTGTSRSRNRKRLVRRRWTRWPHGATSAAYASSATFAVGRPARRSSTPPSTAVGGEIVVFRMVDVDLRCA
jgi:hypothetical protein